jgi:type IV pilus assembly protein PilA
VTVRSRKGFTLIELLVVLTIILIIAGIAIPSLIHIKINANETSAVASIRAIQTAQISYLSTYASQGYAASLAALGGPEGCAPSPATACLLDEVLASGTKDGYVFTVTAGTPVDGANTTFVASAAPAAYNHTGTRRFCATEKGGIRTDLNTSGITTPATREECARFQPLR